MDKLKHLEYVSGIANRLDLQMRNIDGELSNLKTWIREQYDITLNENEEMRIDSYGSIIDEDGADGSESGSGNGFVVIESEEEGEGGEFHEDDYENEMRMDGGGAGPGSGGGGINFDQKPEEIIVQPSTSAFLSAFKFSTTPEPTKLNQIPSIIRGGNKRARAAKHQFSSTNHQMQIIPLPALPSPAGSISQNKLSAIPIHISKSKISQFEKNIQLFTQSQNMRKQQLHFKADNKLLEGTDSSSIKTKCTNFKDNKPHPQQIPFTCNVCLDKFTDFNLLQQHRVQMHNLSTMKVRSSIKIEPEIKMEPGTDLEFEEQQQINNSMENTSMPQMDTYSYYKCKFCDKVFITKHKLNLHKYRVHRAELEVDLPFKCSHDNCGQTFMSETSLENHNEVSHKGLVCKHCQRPFFKRSSFFNHLERVHLCCARAGCEKMFSSKNSLLIHKRKHNARTNKLLRNVNMMGD